MFILTELGSRLKEARLAKGYSLDDLQEITKIQKRYLQAIEEGNYSIMPGTFYVRAFIKQYAEAVGLDPEQILTLFQHEVPGEPAEQVTQSMSQSPSRRKSSKGPSNKMLEAMPKYIVAAFIIVILVFVAFLFQQKTKDDTPLVEEEESEVEIEQTTPIEPEEKEPAVMDEQQAESEEPVVKQTISEGTVEPDGATTTYTLTDTTTLKIRIEVSGDTWVSVKNADTWTEIDTTTDKVFKEGEVVEVDATEVNQTRIRLGASQNAKVYINDELLEYAAPERTTQNLMIIFNKEQ